MSNLNLGEDLETLHQIRPKGVLILFSITFFPTAIALSIVVWFFAQLREKRRLDQEEIKRLVNLDGLTGVANRRYFDKQFAEEWQRSRRTAKPLGLIMVDIDFFKSYNDTYGHQSGDQCLKLVAKALQAVLRRPGDLFARYGGEEFVALLPDNSLEGTAKVADSMRLAVMDLKIRHKHSQVDENVTISLGVGSIQPDEFQTPEALLAIADQALYKAKNDGRNQIALADQHNINAQGLET